MSLKSGAQRGLFIGLNYLDTCIVTPSGLTHSVTQTLNGNSFSYTDVFSRGDGLSNHRMYILGGDNSVPGRSGRMDWIRVRKYVQTEPAFTYGTPQSIGVRLRSGLPLFTLFSKYVLFFMRRHAANPAALYSFQKMVVCHVDLTKKAKYCDLNWRISSPMIAFLNSPGAPGSVGDSGSSIRSSSCRCLSLHRVCIPMQRWRRSGEPI